MAEPILTAMQLRKQLDYNPHTGLFLCKANPTREKGRLTTNGYRQIMVNGERFAAHRLAWLYAYGQWPEGQIDHINRVKDDNRIENLRVVTPKQNNENQGVQNKNTSGYSGVRWSERNRKWVADIGHLGKSVYLGMFVNKQFAIEARLSAEARLFTHRPVCFTIPSRCH